tara:strand:- start:162 stop:320 length:159 start_codon:yes stop_codon:yes gene_type:complete
MSDQWHGGKGSRRKKGNDKTYLTNWEKIFGNKKINISDLKEIVDTKNKNGSK